jgi:hypothetical protein
MLLNVPQQSLQRIWASHLPRPECPKLLSMSIRRWMALLMVRTTMTGSSPCSAAGAVAGPGGTQLAGLSAVSLAMAASFCHWGRALARDALLRATSCSPRTGSSGA